MKHEQVSDAIERELRCWQGYMRESAGTGSLYLYYLPREDFQLFPESLSDQISPRWQLADPQPYRGHVTLEQTRRRLAVTVSRLPILGEDV